MKHIGTHELTTERLVLRRFCLNDAQAMFDNWASDPDVTEFLRWPAHTDISISQAVLEDWVKSYQYDDFYQWAIVPKDLGKPIGCIGVVERNDDIKMVHIGYAIGKRWWHNGYTSEALAALIEFFFVKLGVNRIESQHDPHNLNSGKVMQKCGMKYEGTMKQADFSNKGIVDACMYSILKDEWNL